MLMLNFHRTQDTAYVTNNLFYRNQWRSPDVESTVMTLVGEAASNNTLIGPEILRNQRGIFVGADYDSNISASTNNSIVGFKAAFDLFDLESEINVSYTNIWETQYDFLGPGEMRYLEGNLQVDPMFADTTSFQLQAYSPLIDAGDPNILDVDGTRSDIGCYGGPGGCSYVYLDLAPQIPDSIVASVDSSGVTLTWHINTEADFNHYQLFKDTVAGFEPSVFDMIAEPETSYYFDSDINSETAYYYKLTSVDNQGNVSEYSDEVAVIPTYAPSFMDDGLPKQTAISCAYPNPSNANVTIVYSASNIGYLPQPVELRIYDINGRLVRTLVDEDKWPGTYRAVWDGTNDNGAPVASGTYFAKVFHWGIDGGDFPVKITLLK